KEVAAVKTILFDLFEYLFLNIAAGNEVGTDDEHHGSPAAASRVGASAAIGGGSVGIPVKVRAGDGHPHDPAKCRVRARRVIDRESISHSKRATHLAHSVRERASLGETRQGLRPGRKNTKQLVQLRDDEHFEDLRLNVRQP